MKEIVRSKRAGRFLLVVVCLLAAACDQLPKERFLTPPLVAIRRHGEHEFFVKALPAVPMAELVDMSVFEKLEPGLNFDQVEIILGKPLFVSLEGGRDDVRSFSSSQGGRIEVVRQTIDSEDRQSESWFLRFALNEPCAPCYVNAPIWKIVPDQPERLSLSVSTDDGQVKVELNKKRLVRLWWLREGPVVHPVFPEAREREASR
jgi:hypothetical protein